MDVVGSEIGQKMRSAIKAKLTELGCYVDDELPDYVMVMVANKRTRSQMEEDLQLFLGDNTDLFVNWLHQVLKKLQEVTVTAPLKAIESEKDKERSQSKERKVKEKKEKDKKGGSGKKGKKKEKEKEHKKKDDKKIHKTKKKSKYHKMIRPNVPPLLMNIEKQSEPSITDVFAGQILKNHGIDLDDDKKKLVHIEEKNVVKETKRPILPIIDPATISTQPESVLNETSTTVSITCVREEQMKEMHEIEAKISGLKQKLADQLESMSDDEDFLNIRTEAEELMNDFAEDSFQEGTQTAPIVTPPLITQKSPITSPQQLQSIDTPGNIPKEPIETLPHIELNLPKRSVRERLGARETIKAAAEIPTKAKVMATKPASPERFTPEREPEVQVPPKSAKSRLCSTPERPQRSSTSEQPSVRNELSKKLNSKVSMLERPATRSTCASVVRVRPRPRVSAPASNLLLKAVADAHKSLLNAPPKIETDQQKPKRALVLPMRRSMQEVQKIVIQVPGDTHAHTDTNSDVIISANIDSDSEDKNNKQANGDLKKKDFAPIHITKVINNTEYVPNRVTSQKDDTLVIDTINIHTPTVNKDRGTQFIVTMDGYLPNAFLAKKLMMEGLLDDEDVDKSKIIKPPKSVLKTKGNEEQTKEKEVKTAIVQEKLASKSKNHNQNSKTYSRDEQMKDISHAIDKHKKLMSDTNAVQKTQVSDKSDKQKKQLSDKSDIQKKNQVRNKSDIQKQQIGDTNDNQKTRLSDINNIPKKRLSDTSEESDTQVIIKQEEPQSGEKRKSSDIDTKNENSGAQVETPPLKKRKASPIVYNIDKTEKEIERVRERTQSASSDTHVTVSTTANSHKYDSVLPLNQAERKLVWCRSFPLCRYGGACAFAHPRCKFAASCTRRGCLYSHELIASPALSSHVIPAANYKTITTGNVTNICRFYPNCVNAACHYYHPKPCRYGKACVNKLECNFYHNDAPSDKWKYSL